MSEKVNKYLNAKIYMIKSEKSDKIYIGSTCKSLGDRLKQHETDFKRYKNGNFHMVTSFEILELGDYYILLLENVKVETKKEVEQIEGNYIKKYPNVNKYVPGRTKKKWTEDNKIEVREKKKSFYQENKNSITEKQKEYYKKNKDEIDLKRSIKFDCSCGGKYIKSNQSTHLKSIKHQQYEQNKT